LPKYDHFIEGTRREAYRVKNKRGKMVTRYRTIKVPLTFTGFATNQDVLNLPGHAPGPTGYGYRPHEEILLFQYQLCPACADRGKDHRMSFPAYMTTYVFKPLGMNSIPYIFSRKGYGQLPAILLRKQQGIQAGETGLHLWR
jgi:hypothetical protein